MNRTLVNSHNSSAVAGCPVTAPDFFATICKSLGIDWEKEVLVPGERPMRLVEKSGKPVDELFA